ncbi:hypothetical protein PYW07_012924 [Mythimna separata]|uniref:DDE-1 domain-containing protein n=1 Tax=Mythimna separata TaxID=271217 RepID=A0AAD7Y997_MYTSE|nr:hypothetical protein PYW07_012924 [Mythimna separata]
MVRNRKRKTDYGLHSEKDMAEAILMVESGVSLRKAANEKHVNFMTLQRYVQKKKKCSEHEAGHIRLTPNYANRVVFSVDQEKALQEYLVNCSRMCYGLDTIECRKLAYEMAVYYNLNIPKNWEDKKMAGIDWLYGFRKRHTDLTLRKPEPCSLTRATSFNRHNVNVFFNNLEDVMRRCPRFADGSRVYCLDETGTTTVQKPKKIIAAKGAKQLNKVTSAERGTLVTTCCVVSATGSSLPPAMVFPRKQFKSFMLNGAPVGTLGLAQPTGWMNSDLFPEVMKHFVKVTASTKENPSLLIVDNHDSHLAPAVLNIAKDNGVTLLTIPPHSSHRLQPLDVSVFGPLQTYYNAAMDSWLMRHPGKTISIYNIAELLGQAFDRAMTPSNIKSGFRKTGIFPFDRHIFTDNDYMPSEVTNRPLEALSNAPGPSQPYETQQASTDAPSSSQSFGHDSQKDQNATRSSYSSQIQRGDVTDPRPYPSIVQTPASPVRQMMNRRSESVSPSILTQLAEAPSIAAKENSSVIIIPSTQNETLVSPLGCRAYPKAQPRLQSNRGRKRGKSCIPTDTPIKNEIEKESWERERKKLGKQKKVSQKKEIPYKRLKTNKNIKRVLFSDDESDVENIPISSSDSLTSEDELPLNHLVEPKKNDFVVVQFVGKQLVKHYVGKLLTDIENNEYDVSYLRRSGKVDNHFYFPIEPDMATVPLDDIKIVLPLVNVAERKTKRQTDVYTFPKNILKKFNIY